MHRFFAMIAALALTAVTVSSACTAAPQAGAVATGTLAFVLEPTGKDGRLQAHFRKHGRNDSSWSSSFSVADLEGLDVARFRAPGTSPLRFAIDREAGRIDCSGTGGNSLARGTCSVAADPAFAALLASRGIGRPSVEQAFGLIALDVRRELIEALAAARYPTPGIDELIGLTAVGVTRSYIDGLASAGYRPDSLDTLLEFAALGITPDYIGRFVRLGYGKLPASELVQLKALNVTPEFIAGFERIGYGRLPADELTQLKALGVTPDYVAGFRRLGYRELPVDSLVAMKALGVTPEFASQARRNGALRSPEELVRLRATSGL